MRTGPLSAGRGTRINSATTTLVKTGTALLKYIVFTTPAATSTIQVQDGNGTTNVALGTVTHGATAPNPYFLEFQVQCTNGIRIITSSTDDLLVVWE